MAVYFITGKLGSGKTLVSVGKIRDALVEGRKVATNLNIRQENLVGRKARKTQLYRLPDKPVAEDMFQLGSGNDTYDEEKNGLIVLDECGTWFNSRDWQDKSRKALIDWLLHARKLGWDVIFIIQDVSMIDKQARKSICEHVVYCRRLDRLKIPLLDFVAKAFLKKGMPKPKIHMAIVKYGDLPTSLTVDRWFYTGTDLYAAYDTKQSFVEDYPHKLYQVLPPWYSHGRYAVKWSLTNIMRITRIYLKRFSKVLVLSSGIVAGAAIASMMQPEPAPAPVTQSQPETQLQPEHVQTDLMEIPDHTVTQVNTVKETFRGFVLDGVASNQAGEVIYVSIGNGEERYNADTLRAQGYVVRMVNKCELLIMNEDRSENVRLHTAYCGPDKPPVTPPRMSPDERYKWKLEQVRAMERLQKNTD